MTRPSTESTRQRRDQEALLDRRIKALLGPGSADYTPEQWRSLRERLRLPLLYPGQFVAYRDHYEGEGETRQLLRREILCISRSLTALNKRLLDLPEIDHTQVQVSRVETV